MKGVEYYNQLFKTSLEYRKDPKESIYIGVWQEILKMLTKQEPVYELGCGSGQLAKYLMDNGIYYIWGCDYSLEAIKLARKHADKFMVGDVFKVKIPKGTILCTEVLEHIEEDKKVIERIPKGSRFIFSVPDFLVESHVRCFKSEQEIIDRYKMIKINSISLHKVARNKNIYLVDSLI